VISSDVLSDRVPLSELVVLLELSSFELPQPVSTKQNDATAIMQSRQIAFREIFLNSVFIIT
jgi:hypothetical protein